MHPRMCSQDILQFNTIMCPILFAQMCGHVLYIDELKGSPCTLTCWYQHIGNIQNNVNQSDPLNKNIGIHSQLTKKIIIA
jgi:hypothetical protein